MKITSFLRLSRDLAFIQLFSFTALQPLQAGSATWNLTPTSGDWNTAANWTPATVPAAGDTATFDVSQITSVSLSQEITIDSIVFNPGASAFTITQAGPRYSRVMISGEGIVNNSEVTQNFVTPGTNTQDFYFTGTATAGSGTVCTCNGGGRDYDAGVTFFDSSNAGSATFIANGGDDHPGNSSGEVFFEENSSAANGTFIANPGHFLFGGYIVVYSYATAGNGTFICNGGTPERPKAGVIQIYSTAGDANFTINGTDTPGATAGSLYFYYGATAANATLIANGGTKSGGSIVFFVGSGSDHTDGGTCTIKLFGNGQLDIGQREPPGVTIGSLEGDGIAITGANTLTIGSNNKNTTYSGVAQDGGIGGGTGGSLGKIGTGTLTLSGANIYTGGTTVKEGTLLGQTKLASATGTGPVQVNGGILGGRGKMAGAVTIGTGSGSGSGAFLAPGVNGPAGLTTQGSLTFNSDGTYNWEVDVDRSKADKVTAKGVTIQSGAQFAFSAKGSNALAEGTVFRVIDNRSRQPVAGTFANLADGSTFTANGNTFQASYEGGNGNDLTLTVVP